MEYFSQKEAEMRSLFSARARCGQGRLPWFLSDANTQISTDGTGRSASGIGRFCRFSIFVAAHISGRGMTKLMRTYLGISLALMLALTGQSMAVARGTPSASGEIILCTGTGPISVLVDENGQPVGKPHICPDCALSVFAALGEEPPQLLRPEGRVTALRIEIGKHEADSQSVPARARGPPVLV